MVCDDVIIPVGGWTLIDSNEIYYIHHLYSSFVPSRQCSVESNFEMGSFALGLLHLVAHLQCLASFLNKYFISVFDVTVLPLDEYLSLKTVEELA